MEPSVEDDRERTSTAPRYCCARKMAELYEALLLVTSRLGLPRLPKSVTSFFGKCPKVAKKPPHETESPPTPLTAIPTDHLHTPNTITPD
jgi:hypothetical protein